MRKTFPSVKSCGSSFVAWNFARISVFFPTAIFPPRPVILFTQKNGRKTAVGKKTEILAKFQATKDEPQLFTEGKFFLIHAPGAIAAIYRRCTHLGCAVPWNAAEDQFHCPCHGSLFDKHTATVKGGPAPRPLDLFHVIDQGGTLIIDTNPLNLPVRASNEWDPKHAEVNDA